MKTARNLAAFLMVLLAASAWPLLTTVFAAAAPQAGLWVLAVACLLAVAACLGRFDAARFEWRYLVAVPLLAVAGWLIPWPLSIGAVVLAAALILGALLRSAPRARVPATAAAVFGAVLLFQAMALAPVLGVMARRHSLPHVSGLVARVLNFLGAEAAAGVESLTLVTVRDSYVFPVSPELFGFPTAAVALIGGLTVALCLGGGRGRLRTALTVLVAWVLYLPLRAVLCLLLFLQLQLYVDYFAEAVRADILWTPWWQLTSFLPLAVLWGLACRMGGKGEERASALARYRPTRHTVALALAIVGAALIALAVAFHDSGTPEARRVMIDEHNSEWEKTTRAPGTRWYGTLSMYNMFSIADYLGYHYEVTRNTEPLSDEVLSKTDVLILKTPTSRYATEEIDAVERFVRRGGGLFMIGEHTNYVGSAVYLNSIGRRLGLRFREDCLFHLAGSDPYVQVWQRPKLLYHPIVAHIPRFRFEVSCSVTSNSPDTRAVMLSTGLFGLTADYFMENYYPYPRRSTDMYFGPFCQLAARDVGRGRVAAYTDSTNLSNFSAFYPGRAEMVLATVDWLGRTHRGGAWRWVLGVLGGLALAGGVFVTLRLPEDIGGMSLLAAGVAFGCVAALAFARASVARDFPLPQPHTPPVHVGFLREHCEYELPIDDFVRDRERSFDLFFQWMLRMRYFPRVRETLASALKDDLLVVINPQEEFPARHVHLIHRAIESGGTALVLLGEKSNRDAVRSLLDLFQIEIEPDLTFHHLPVLAADGTPTGVITDSLLVRGGETLYRMGQHPVAAVHKLGKGKLVVVGFGECFKDAGMGHTNATLPNAQLRARFRLQFELLEYLLPPGEHLPAGALREVKEDTAWMR